MTAYDPYTNTFYDNEKKQDVITSDKTVCMTKEEKKKAIDALKISAPVMAVTQEEFNDYIQTLNKIMNWLEQEPSKDIGLGRR